MTKAGSWAIGFDADDTLWHNERVFQMTQARFAALLSDFADPGHLDQCLLATERRNLGQYGFGVKGFVLSMIETAIQVTDQKVPAHIIEQLLQAGREMLAHPIELLPHARDCIESLAPRAKMILITKGDLLDQERKLAQSGLGDLFDQVDIVSTKTPDTYTRIFAPQGQRAMMVGNSLKSDVNPALKAGFWGVHVPHDLAWDLEHAPAQTDHARFRQITDLGALPELFESIV